MLEYIKPMKPCLVSLLWLPTECIICNSWGILGGPLLGFMCIGWELAYKFACRILVAGPYKEKGFVDEKIAKRRPLKLALLLLEKILMASIFLKLEICHVLVWGSGEWDGGRVVKTEWLEIREHAGVVRLKSKSDHRKVRNYVYQWVLITAIVTWVIIS